MILHARKNCLSMRCSFQCQDEQKLTPLHLACTYGQIEVARLLLENGASIRSIGEKKQTSLHKAAAVGNVELVKMLIYAVEQVYGPNEVHEVVFQRIMNLLKVHFKKLTFSL